MEDRAQLLVSLAGLQVGDEDREELRADGTQNGITQAQAPPPPTPPGPADHVTNVPWDWTDALPNNDHVRFLKSINWGDTLLGPIHAWSLTLRQAVYQVIADSRPATLYW
jgi:hypothetical protein